MTDDDDYFAWHDLEDWSVRYHCAVASFWKDSVNEWHDEVLAAVDDPEHDRINERIEREIHAAESLIRYLRDLQNLFNGEVDDT